MYTIRSLLGYGFALLMATDNLPLARADINPFVKSEEYMKSIWGAHPRQRYLSDSVAIGPVGNIVNRTAQGRSPSRYILYAPYGPLHPPNAPTVLDADTLSMVWYGPIHGKTTVGPTVHTCKGTQYLTFWSGMQLYDRPAGSNYFYDTEYNLRWNVSTQGHLEYADSHEMFLTPQCTAIISAFQTRPYDFAPFGPSEGFLKDSFFQEVDLDTGKLLFEWQASAHVDLTESYWNPRPGEKFSPHAGFDFFHMNSVAKDEHGNYLISARHTRTVYYVSGRDGTVLWRLGGKLNDFKDLSEGHATDFKWQHFARWIDANTISLYDNANAEHHAPPEGTLSRGLVLRLDFDAKTVRIEHSYNSTNGILSMREGSMQYLHDSPQPGNALLGYGGDPGWTEYSPDGAVVDDVMFGPVGADRKSADNYRALKVNWTGTPQWTPSIAPGPDLLYHFDAEHSIFQVLLNEESGTPRPNTTAYFSWNGATEVAYWVVLTSNTTADLNIAEHFWAQVPKRGYEDSCYIGYGTKYALALAIDTSGNVLGSTDTMDMANYINGQMGPKTGRSRNTDDLTAALRKYVSGHPSGSLLAQLQKQWHGGVEAIAQQPHISLALVGLLVLCILALLIVVRRMRWNRGRSGYFRTKMANMVLPRSSRDAWSRDYSDGEETTEDKDMLMRDSPRDPRDD
ncbi:hypothetical protein KVT40_004339 [Elsinoe batatas]|uniref:ASST-domain-containing protein n=1 Tax=Elsinoe batatas TaxID=2601811 RepID=A0A8K0L226_9PEZI|nr:hypothetical protein KVT40_004339 [Elsinoe batatas]